MSIPFKNDLLFNFFNKKTQITDTYLLDPISTLKLYPKKSGAVKATAVNSCIPVSKTILTNTAKIRSVFKHKIADLNNFGYVWAGANVSSPYSTTGLYLTTGKLAYSMYWFGSTSGACNILTSALEDDNYYLCTQTVGETNISMKMNKLTNVNNAIIIGSDINSTTTAKGTEELTGSCFGVLSACYSNGSYNYASGNQMVYIEFLDANDNILLSFNFSEGSGEQVFDIISGNAFAISNITVADFWNQTQDFNHYNFRYGFTLYQKTGEADIRIPNKKDGSEIILPAPPTGYTRIANYKDSRLSFNNSENVFVLDNVDVQTITLSGALTPTGYNGVYIQNGTWAGNPKYDKIDDAAKNIWKSGAPYDVYGWAIGDINNLAHWFEYLNGDGDDLTPFPWDVAVFTPFGLVGGSGDVTVSLTTTSALKTADIDDVLFDDTGVAKELTITALYSEIVDLTRDRGHLYINSDSNKNMMLYKTDKGVDTPEDLKIWAYVEK